MLGREQVVECDGRYPWSMYVIFIKRHETIENLPQYQVGLVHIVLFLDAHVCSEAVSPYVAGQQGIKSVMTLDTKGPCRLTSGSGLTSKSTSIGSSGEPSTGTPVAGTA